MLEFRDIDMLARGGSLALLLLWTAILVRDHRRAFAARLAIAMNLGIIGHVIATIPKGPWPSSPVGNLLDIASSSVFGLFWLFSRAWFEDTPRFGWRSWALALLPSAFIGWLHMVQPDFMAPLWRESFPFIRLAWFALGIAGLWVAWRSRDDDLIEGRRRLRLALIGVVGGLAIMVNIIEIGMSGFGAPRALRGLTQIAIFFATLSMCAAMFKTRQADLFGPVRRDAPSPLPFQPDEDPLAGRLLAHMDANRPYRDETLTIAVLAGQLGEPEYRLRRLINGQLGHRNFAAFLNGYRLAEIKAALADPAQREVPILTIALDAGFGSLGPFNRAFREAEGMTPSAWRARESGIDAKPVR